MTKKEATKSDKLKRLAPYVAAGVGVFLLAFFGSMDKRADADGSTSLQSIATNNFTVSQDQVSEFYMVAQLADTMELSTSNEIINNYVSVSVLQQDGQTTDDTTGKIQKPNIVDVSHLSRGVVNYTVGAGESMEAVAARYGVTTDQIRWSNNLKTTEVSEGQQLLIPATAGIVYTVKDGDTVQSLSDKYGSSKEQIIAYNDLEKNETLSTGTVIILPSGSLPETERPEYVAPTPSYSSSYSYSTTPTYTNYSIGSNGARENMTVVERWTYASSMLGDGNKMTPGQCTWYAWYWRKHFSNNPLPSAAIGNANAWASTLARYGFTVDHTPSYGAVFQTPSGYYGHVGIVVGVNSDGSIKVREMNYQYQAYTVIESTIPAGAVGMYYYIH